MSKISVWPENGLIGRVLYWSVVFKFEKFCILYENVRESI